MNLSTPRLQGDAAMASRARAAYDRAVNVDPRHTPLITQIKSATGSYIRLRDIYRYNWN